MSIRGKIIGYYTITLVIVIVFFMILSTFTIRAYLYDEVKSDLYEEARLTSMFLKDSIESLSDKDINIVDVLIETRQKATTYKLDSVMGYVIYSRLNKEVVSSSKYIPKLAFPYITNSINNENKEISFTVDDEQYFGVLYLVTNDEFEEKFPILARRSKMSFYLLVYVSNNSVNLLVREIVKKQLFIMIMAIVIMLIVGVFIANSITKPLRKLGKQASKIAKREYEPIIGLPKKHEIGQLVSSINKMIDELKQYDESQKRFLQNASHELKTPLMSIKGYAEGMIDGVVNVSKENLTIIIEESERLKKIVEGISLLSRIETKNDYFSFKKMYINDVVINAIDKAKGIATNKNKQLIFSSHTEAICLIDDNQFVQALINIYGNCLRYATREINTIITEENKQVIITIYDDGPGFNENDIPHVFERFYKGLGGQNGIGLAITQSIIISHQGTIRVSNNKEGGAKYIITLPIVYN